MLNRRRGLQRYDLQQGKLEHNVQLKGKKLALHGIADAIILTEDEVCPVEFKIKASAVQRGQILQLAAYGLLAEERYGKPFRRGFILYGPRGKTHQVIVDDELREQVRSIAESMLGTFNSQLMPASSAGVHQCAQCEYLNFCADRETDVD